MTTASISPTIDLIHEHGSVRKYRAEPVPAALVEQIVAAAQRTSTSSNLQMWSVVAATDPAVRRSLSEVAGQGHVAQAPVVFVWCADLSRLDRACELRSYTQVSEYVENFLLAAVDAAIASQTAALAAESLGLGICYIGALRNDPGRVVELLNLPRLVFPLVGMTMGYPDGQPPIRPRLPLAAVLHWNAYDRTAEDASLHAYDRAMIATGIYQGRQVAVPGQTGEMEDYGWLEHSARRVSTPTRTELRRFIEQQGYELR